MDSRFVMRERRLPDQVGDRIEESLCNFDREITSLIFSMLRMETYKLRRMGSH